MTQNRELESIDLPTIARLLWSEKKVLALSIIVFFLASVTYALNSPDVYQSSSTLAPASTSKPSSLSSLSGQIGSIASLAGINLSSGTDESTTYLAILKSRKFINTFINRYELKPHLFPDSWDNNTNQWKPPSVLSTFKKRLITYLRPQPPTSSDTTEPSDWDAYKAFITNNLSISEDSETGLITVRVSSYSPNLSQEWTETIIRDLNQQIREEKKAEAERSIAYLQKSIGQTPLVDMQGVLYRLIETQMQTIVLANIKEEFAFTTLDPAVAPQEKSRPNRTLIVVSGILFGLIIGILIVFSSSLTLKRTKREPAQA